MIERFIRASAARPAVSVILALAGTAFGVMSLQNLRRDVFPDLSAPVFNVIVQNPSMGAEELETGISIHWKLRSQVCPRFAAFGPCLNSGCVR